MSDSNILDSSSQLEKEASQGISTCMICMEDWTIGTEHRITCLKCGHLFGRSCIERWIKEKGSNARCPSCNKVAKKGDLRDLWCKTISATDASELADMQQKLEAEKKSRRVDSATIFHQNMRLDMLLKNVEVLKQKIIERDAKIATLEDILNRYNNIRAQQISGDTVSSEISMPHHHVTDIEFESRVVATELKGSFHFVEIVRDSNTSSGCKVFSLCPTSSLMLVAHPAPTGMRNIFGGFGLRKYSTIDFGVREYIPLHSKIITSMQLKPLGDLILTSGQDRKVQLTSISNNTCIQSYQCQHEPTSVSWSAHRDQQFYVASGNCYVTLFDLRNTSEFIYQTSQKVANTRILSITATACPLNNLNGLLVNDTKGCQFLKISDQSSYDEDMIDRSIDHLSAHQLPFDGIMGTVDYNKKLDLALITTRRSSITRDCMHSLVKLEKVLDEAGGSKVECRQIRSFSSQSLEELSQSRILKHPTLNDNVLIGACDAEAKGIKLWDPSDNTIYQSIRTDSFVRDMVLFSPENSNQHVLYTLSEKGIGIYRWDYA